MKLDLRLVLAALLVSDVLSHPDAAALEARMLNHQALLRDGAVPAASVPATANDTRRLQTSTDAPSSAPSYRMQFETQSAADLVTELLNGDTDTVEIENVVASAHIDACAALFTRGHTLGNLFERDPDTHQPIQDANGEYIPTDTPIVPDRGIILSSGKPEFFNINDSDQQTHDHQAGGDPDLKATVDASNGLNNPVHDACILQFDFRCKTEGFVPTLVFNFIWGSEEYYEYVDSIYNDVFGFYLNGENIARLPTTDTNSDIVSINNVNFNNNTEYFHGNDPGTGWDDPLAPPPETEVYYPLIEADGFTDTLTAVGTPYNDQRWNTIKLAVADVGDFILDSWVVLEGASFECVDITSAPSTSLNPTGAPTDRPSISTEPTANPSMAPSTSSKPSGSPSEAPTSSSKPSESPSDQPSISSRPSDSPSLEPSTSSAPSIAASVAPSTSTQPTGVPSDAPTTSSKPSESPSLQPSVSSKPSESPSVEPSTSSAPSYVASVEPSTSSKPTGVPSGAPTTSSKPSQSPSLEPTLSSKPSESPSSEPSTSSAPSYVASVAPSTSSRPSGIPSGEPTSSSKPSESPSLEPSISSRPTESPSVEPSTSSAPSYVVSVAPSTSSKPSGVPSNSPTTSSKPSESPSMEPTSSAKPTGVPSESPTLSSKPTLAPTDVPSTSTMPTATPSASPTTTSAPSRVGSYPPSESAAPSTSAPTEVPTLKPSMSTEPTVAPSGAPSVSSGPTGVPSGLPTLSSKPSESPSDEPSTSSAPTESPSLAPSTSSSPTITASLSPSTSSKPSQSPSLEPTTSSKPSESPSQKPSTSSRPSESPSMEPTTSTQPTGVPSEAPTVSSMPTLAPSDVPSTSTAPTMAPSDAPSTSSGPTITASVSPSTSSMPSSAPTALGSIGPNVVFNDLDEDGEHDEDEPPLVGVNVALYCNGQLIETVVTNSNGEYEFVNIVPASCYIQVDPEVDGNDNYVFSPICELPCTNGNVIYPNGTSPEEDIAVNENVDDWNVGLYLPMSEVSSVAFNDVNEDGVHDQDEEALQGVAVALVCDGSEVATTVTNDQGVYAFTDVAPGDCHVSVTPEVGGNDNYVFSPVVQDGNQIGQDGNSPTATIGYNATVDSWPVGMYLPISTIGPNTVFNDFDQDGIHDESEPPFAEVLITLMCDGQAVATTASNVNGTYEFTNVPPGECYIQVNSPSDDHTFSPVVVGGNQIDPDGNSPTATIGYGTEVDTWDVGMYLPPATIGPNEVFDDQDGDGERDPLEPPLENVPIDLYCLDENGQPVLTASTTSNATGHYQFDGVQPGQCYISVTPQDNYTFSPICVSPCTDGNQIYPNGTSPIVDIDWNDVIDDWNVGMYLPVTIGNKVWDDANGSGIQEPSEDGIAGVDVTLVDGNGDPVATTQTAADGSYWFTDLPPGDYAVQFALPASYVFAPAPPQLMLESMNFQTPPDIAADINADPNAANIGETPTKTLASGANDTSFDAGIYIPVVVDGLVWDDLNANGIKDNNEPGLEGAGITVFDNGNNYAGYVTSDEFGYYSVSLAPGSYYGLISPPVPDFKLSPKSNDPNGSDYDPSTMKSDTVLLASGETGMGSFDAGFYEPATVTSRVWEDADGDGIQDPEESGYTGPLTVNLYDPNDGPDADPVMTTSTNPADGTYSLDDVLPGTYEIEFVPLDESVAFSPKDQGNDDTKDSDVDPITGRAPLVITSGESVTDLAAGVTNLPTIGPNPVFRDDNANGVQDPGEPGIEGVAVVLYKADGSEVGVAVTDGDGNYQFPGLTPGESYYISVNADPTYEFSPVVPGGNQVSSNPQVLPYQNSSPIITLGYDDDNTLLVGMYEPVIMGNKVWNDANGNGVLDANEPGMADVDVTLRDENGAILEQTTTDSDGHYLFSDRRPGGYSVHFMLPDGYIFTVRAKDSVTITNPAQPENSLNYEDVTSDVDRDTGATDVKYLISGEENYSFDAGMFIPVVINGTTWHDLNADGLEDEGEPGLPGVTVALYDRDGDYVDETTTGPDGVWEFVDMAPGSYSAMITPPTSDPPYQLSPKPLEGSNSTRDTDFYPGSWLTDEIYLQGGEVGDGLFDAGLYLPATIGDYIWFDETPNGIQDEDELPFNQPVTVKMFNDLGYIVGQTESTEAGFYQFTDVRPGSYVLEFILPDEDYQWTLPNAGNDTSVDSNVSPTTDRASVTVTSGEINNSIDAGVMDYGPYYPDWTNDVQVCTNDGFDPSWLEIQEENYLYKNKEECCKNHFWWRMTQCMANEEFKFYSDGEKCDTKIFFEDWEDNSPADWTATTQFDTIQECCANEFWFNYEGCLEVSPVMFKFEFCVDVQGLVDPQDCQSADIYANVIEDAVNEGCNLCDVETDPTRRKLYGCAGWDTNTQALRSRLLEHNGVGDITTADANVTKIGGVSLSMVDGTTVCGGTLGGQGFVNELTGTTPDIEAAGGTVVSVCGVITVEEEQCKTEECLREHYQAIANNLEEFTNNGDLTLAINRRSQDRLPPVPELQVVSALPFSMSTSNLLLPETITGELETKYFHGSDLKTCMEKAVFQPGETPYELLSECCTNHFGYDVTGCCAKGGGCPDLGVAAIEEVTNADGDSVEFYPTYQRGQYCSSKLSTEFEQWDVKYGTKGECCLAHYSYDLAACNSWTGNFPNGEYVLRYQREHQK